MKGNYFADRVSFVGGRCIVLRSRKNKNGCVPVMMKFWVGIAYIHLNLMAKISIVVSRSSSSWQRGAPESRDLRGRLRSESEKGCVIQIMVVNFTFYFLVINMLALGEPLEKRRDHDRTL